MDSKSRDSGVRKTSRLNKTTQGWEPWTKKEKQRLLQGLEKYGDQDLHALQSVVQSKFHFQIELFIRKMKKKARKKFSPDPLVDDRPLKAWYDVMKSKTTKIPVSEPRPQAILALVESIRAPKEMKDAFDCLFRLFSGHRPHRNQHKQVSKETLNFVLSTVVELRKRIVKNRAFLFKALMKSLNVVHYELNPDNYRSVAVQSSSLNPLQLLTEPFSVKELGL